MYKIIGGDQKQYGPVSADEVRAWIAEGRLSAQSLVWSEGAADWKPLGSFPEFADALRGQAKAPIAQAALPPGIAPAYEAQIFAVPPQLRIGQCLERSWALLKANLGLLFGASLIYGLIGLIQLIPGINLIYWIFKGVFEGGFYLIFIRRIRGQPAVVGDVFAGFNIAFVQLLLAGVVSGLLGVLGMCCCILPGIYLVIAWIFGVPLVADKKLEFWSAMELSRKVVTRVWFQTFGLTLLVFLPSILGGTLLFALGGASSSLATSSAVHDILSSSHPDMAQLFKLLWSMAGENLFINFIARIIVIINLPFAVGALMYAYEDLFGTGRTPSP